MVKVVEEPTIEHIDMVKIHKVAYGQVIALKEHFHVRNDLVYLKIDKQRTNKSSGIELRYPNRTCLLFNPKYGNIICINSKTKVVVLNGKLSYQRLESLNELSKYLKSDFEFQFRREVECRVP